MKSLERFAKRLLYPALTLTLAFVAGRTVVVQTVPTITSSPPVSRGGAAAASNAPERRMGSQLEGVPVPFVANEGQTDTEVAYYAPTFAGTVFVTRDGRIVYSLPGKSVDQDGTPQRRPRASAPGGWSLTEAPVGATGDARPAAQKPAQTKINYLHGNDSSAWKSGIATYEEVSLGQVWPGVSVTLRAHGKNVEKVFTVGPGRDPSRIRMRVSGARSLKITATEFDTGSASS